MDKLIHMSLNSLDIALRKQAINAQNLSNANVNGYRRDIYESFGSVYLNARNQIESRAFSTTFGSGAFDETQGRITPTDVPTDLAIDGKGFFIRQKPNSDPSLTRRGDMTISPDGTLTDGTGVPILTETLQVIQLPPFRKLVVAENGNLLIEPLNGEPGITQLIGSLGLVSAEGLNLKKGDDGEIRLANGNPIVSHQNVKVKQGFLEESNVSAIDEMIANIENQRTFELNLKLIKLASQLDEGTSSLLRMPGN